MRLLRLLIVACVFGCADRPQPSSLCVDEAAGEPCRPLGQVEALLKQPDLRILRSRSTPNGRQNAKMLELLAHAKAAPVRFRAKWRALSTSHGLNDPRKELATHAVQKLFLGPGELVFPPTTGNCFELSDYREQVNRKEKPTFAGTRCVYGTLSYWLERAQDPGRARLLGWIRSLGLLDRTAFAHNDTYRRTMADVNLLSHLIDHGDTHSAQFLFTGSRRKLHIWVVDTTIGFSPYRNPTLSRENDWSILHVPALSARSVARLRALRPEQLAALGSLEEYTIRAGRLVRVAPQPVPQGMAKGFVQTGSRLRIGLTDRETEALAHRIRNLLERVDRGELRTF